MKKLLHAFLFLTVFLSNARAQQQKPNVIILFIDDMGYGDLGCYGNPNVQTKNIDALAQRGTRFTQFYVNSPVCSPSRVAMMTGQYPARHQFYTYLAERKKNAENEMPDFLPATVPTLAKMLHANGYATAHIGKWHLGGGRDVGDAPLPTEYGFDKSFTSFEGLGDRTLTMADNLNRQSAQLGRGHIIQAPQNKQTEMYVDSALAFVKGIGNQPFLLNFFPNDVHDPYNPAEGTEKEFAASTDNVHQQKFLATLKELDKQIGRLLSVLDEMGKLQNTLILLTSDNGPTDWPYYYKNGGLPPCSVGDLHGRKWSLYEGGIRVPFIAVWPGKIPAGKVNSSSVMSVVDIVPTVAALTGTTTPADYHSDGADETKILFGSNDKTAGDIYWYYNNNPVPGKAENISPTLAIRSGKWKLLMDPDGSKKQLFNLEKDHRETTNLVDQEKKKAGELSSKLEKWYTEVVKKNADKSIRRNETSLRTRQEQPGRLPAMGWNSWNYFGKKDITEKIVREVIDAMAASGLQKAGYEYVVVDGGWRDTTLGPHGELLVNKKKFPGGIKALADYAHSKGLKFGLHTVPGTHDCGCDKVGGWGVEAVQVKQFVDWGIDFVKLDRCRFSLDSNPRYPRKDPRWYKGWDTQTNNLYAAYAKWNKLLKESGRPILFSASVYKYYDWYPGLTNMGRTTGDIKSNQTGGAAFDNPNNNSVMTVAAKNNDYAKFAKPGYWNDPDMLVTGAQGLTVEEQKAHFALWCIMTAPLILGNDPRNMTVEEKRIITNKEAIAVDQDITEQGTRIKTDGKTEIWAKKLADGRFAVLLLNRDADTSREITLHWDDLQWKGKKKLKDVFGEKEIGTFDKRYSAMVAPHACLFLIAQQQRDEKLNKKPNILFCIADDASRAHMRAYGLTDWVNTPGFDRVASEGLLFMNAYTPNAKCSPSRASILAGRNPWQLEEAANHNPFFPARFTTVIETLANHGYATGFTGKGWGPGNPGERNGKRRQLTGKPYNEIKTAKLTNGMSPVNYAANFEAFLDEKPAGQPFIFWYGGNEPHRPYTYGSGIVKGKKKLTDIDKVPSFWIDNDSVRNDMLDYAYEVEYFDSHLRSMIELLEKKGELENTIIVVTSDNGMPFPRVKGHVYEYANHLPLAVMWKGHIQDAGRKIEDYISFIDFAPTFLQLAGIAEKSSGMEAITGRSFVDILQSDTKSFVNPQRDHVLIGRERTDPGRPHDQGYPVRGIVKNGFIYTHNYKPNRWPSGNPETGYMDTDDGPTKKNILNAHKRGEYRELYDLSFAKKGADELYYLPADTFCMRNIAGEKNYTATVRRLKEQMERELKQQKDPRMFGKGDIFDSYQIARPDVRNYYERFMKGEIKKR